MSLFSSLQLAGNSLTVNQIGLQVTGNNIANADTDGYVRQRMLTSAAPSYRVGNLALGMGAEVDGIVQIIDQFLEERLRSATSDMTGSEIQENTYLELQAVINELTETDLSTSLDRFFASIADILNEPGSEAVRNLAVLQGQEVADDIGRLSSRVREMSDNLNDQLSDAVVNINRLTTEIAKVNIQIIEFEADSAHASDAVGLRDQRNSLLGQLAELINIQTAEQDNGAVNVFCGGDYLVAEGVSREVFLKQETTDGVDKTTVNLVISDSPIAVSAGTVAGLIESHDTILADYLGQLDDFAATFIFEFNKLYSNGQGLSGFQEVTAEHTALDPDAALDQAGLTFTPVNGSFQIKVFDKSAELTKTTDILVRLNGMDDDTTLQDVVDAIDAISGISASLNEEGHLTIQSDSSSIEFSFAEDDSGLLAALGINTFFTGTTALTMGVDQTVRENPGMFAASDTGVGTGTGNAAILADFQNRQLESQDGQTLAMIYDEMNGNVIQAASFVKSVAEGYRVFQETLEGQHYAISGVSLDEEAIRMIAYQRCYQATARFISTVSELLEILVNL